MFTFRVLDILFDLQINGRHLNNEKNWQAKKALVFLVLPIHF
jgi:hypothetical protein